MISMVGLVSANYNKSTFDGLTEERPVASQAGNFARHDPDLLAQAVLEIYRSRAVRIVFGKHATALGPASHAPRTGSHIQVGHAHDGDVEPFAYSLALNGLEHGCHIAATARAAVDYEQAPAHAFCCMS